MAIGTLLRTGELTGERVIALAGPGIRKPRLVRVALGADLDDLVHGEMTEGAHEIVSGSLLDGHPSRFLRRHHWQVSVVPRPPAPTQTGWFARHAGRLKPPSIVATAAIERALALDLPVMPLLRALSVGDSETAARLGCCELLEEDLALVTYAAGATQDFGALSRPVLVVASRVPRMPPVGCVDIVEVEQVPLGGRQISGVITCRVAVRDDRSRQMHDLGGDPENA